MAIEASRLPSCLTSLICVLSLSEGQGSVVQSPIKALRLCVELEALDALLAADAAVLEAPEGRGNVRLLVRLIHTEPASSSRATRQALA